MKRIFLTLSISLILLITGCSPTANTPLPEATSQPEVSSDPQFVLDAEKLAGFDVKVPAYLPAGVSLDSADYQELPDPNTNLHFKLVHEQFGDMGLFFHINQESQPEAPADVTVCGENVTGCEVLQIGGVPVVYHLYDGGTEGLDWYADGFVFRLLRTAGEPGKIYKDELVKVVESMQ